MLNKKLSPRRRAYVCVMKALMYVSALITVALVLIACTRFFVPGLA